jgi:hypothetical protein
MSHAVEGAAGSKWTVELVRGEQSGLQTHIATMESVSLRVRMKVDHVCGATIGDFGSTSSLLEDGDKIQSP